MNADKRRWFCAICSLVLLLSVAFASALAAEEPDLYSSACKSFVEILIDNHLDGSGWIATADGIAVTAAHVVGSPGRRIEINSESLGRLDAKVIAVDRGNDTALLKLPARDAAYPALTFAEKVPVATSTVYLLGSPIYRHSILHSAMIARNKVTYEFLFNPGYYVRVFHISGFGSPGSSGGPWLNTKGEVIGLNSGVMRDGAGSAGIGFMVPVDAIRALVRTQKTPGTATLGAAFEEIWEQNADYIKKFPAKTEGLVLRSMKKEGPALKAGLAEFDLIIAIDDKPVRLRDEAMEILRTRKSGDVLKVKVLLPAGNFTEKTVPLGDLEADWNAIKNDSPAPPAK